ncbi:MAG: DUF4124 domain-containing protein [Thiobacillaceae bacterium]
MRRGVLLLLTLCNLPPAWAETYRWVDERGRVHYSDTKPPLATEQTVLDKQGRVLRKLPRTGTVPETAADERMSARDIARERQDRALLSTYVHEGEIDLARDRALAQEKARQTSLQAMLKQVNERIARIEAEVAAVEQAGRRIPDALRQSRSEAQREAARLSELLEYSQVAAARIEARYEAYKLRFRELKGRAAEPRLGAAPAEGNAIP